MNVFFRITLLLTAALALTLTGCSTTSKNVAPEPEPAMVAAPPPPAPAPAPAAAPRYVIDEDVTFDFDKSKLKPAATATLDQVVDGLRQQSTVTYEVAGFTDSVGSDAYNQRLSERRAAAVHDYLVTHGVSAGQLTTRGYGETSPVASNATSAGRSQNRRVEVRPLQ
jgi:outer membrane protein OmpA-like peptidoglycan-associated protein